MNNGLLDALKAIGWPDLPNPIDANYKKRWIKAIVKVRKYNGSESYCIAVNDGNGKPHIIKDFGPTSIISNVISIHPYEETSKKLIPWFRTDRQIVSYLTKSDYDASEITALLSKDGKTPEQIKRDRDIVNGYIEQVAIEQARIMSAITTHAQQNLDMAAQEPTQTQTKKRKYVRTTARKTKKGQG